MYLINQLNNARIQVFKLALDSRVLSGGQDGQRDHQGSRDYRRPIRGVAKAPYVKGTLVLYIAGMVYHGDRILQPTLKRPYPDKDDQ